MTSRLRAAGWDRHSCLSLLLLPILAGCVPQAPFTPAPVRFGRVDYLEARDALAAPAELDLRLSRDALASTDVFLATLRIAPSLVGKKLPARLTILRADSTAPAAALDLADIRNTQLDVHVHLRNAPAGRYTLRVEVGPLSDEKPFAVQ